MIKIDGVKLSEAAAANVEEAGVSVAEDVQRLREGLTVAHLLAECLAGAEPDREQGWRDYVRAVELTAAEG